MKGFLTLQFHNNQELVIILVLYYVTYADVYVEVFPKSRTFSITLLIYDYKIRKLNMDILISNKGTSDALLL